MLIPMLLSSLIRQKKSNPPSPLPPGPKSLPFVGCIFQMLRNRPTFEWMHKIMHEMNTEIACFRLGGIHVIPVTSPEIAREFLKKQDSIFSSRPVCMSAELPSSKYLSAVLSPSGNQQKKMKKIVISSVLSPAKHRWLHGKRIKEADHLVNYILNQCNNSLTGGEVNIRIAARHYCGNVTRRLFFDKRFFGRGTEDGGPGTEEVEHVEALFTILDHLFAFSLSDYVPWMRSFDMDGHEKILSMAVGSVRKDGTGRPLLTTEEIKAQIMELMLAAVDNPSNAIEWVLAEMLNQPELLQKATQELDTVVGRDRLVQEFDLPRLKYIKACIKEAFRLHPISPFNVPHVSTQDTIVGGYFIPKGSHVLLSRLGLGRNPRIWEDPLKFKPERHLEDLDELKVDLNNQELHLLSFGIGRRGCPGVQLGSTMSIMLLARLLHSFTWEIPRGLSRIDLTESPLFAIAKPRLAIL
ncbi:phenylalanine N-monooxygenase-like isoform X2 [Coffea eugenioides]|uniref:phenylalanine N-monooxygenase-like isoform X2 n=1 Tax=Coffea eugenioides TaxID=49369 RepID=UPI000F61136C|nr:phenylalanine N-monooxygenase-like isoform X2 [Coffea eugenioides]